MLVVIRVKLETDSPRRSHLQPESNNTRKIDRGDPWWLIRSIVKGLESMPLLRCLLYKMAIMTLSSPEPDAICDYWKYFA